ncbi:hypothetical protein RJ55_08573 [Drechmeria coniospora]|nr:hypothetical protein RJ55_08573 [Drechmeria coniospora]
MNSFFPRVLSRGRASLPHATTRQQLSHSLLPTIHAAFLSQAAITPAPKSSRTHSQPPLPPPCKSPEELARLSYMVRRTPSTQLPIYRRTLSGGTRQVVVIKKIDGDKRRMLEDIVEALNVSKEDVRINPTTQHIELKGKHFDKAREWLIERGF